MFPRDSDDHDVCRRDRLADLGCVKAWCQLAPSREMVVLSASLLVLI